MRSGAHDISRTEAGVLSTLEDGPRRITELAATEALAQPTVTQLVDKLQGRGLVARGRADDDGRVVLVAITAAAASSWRSSAPRSAPTCARRSSPSPTPS